VVSAMTDDKAPPPEAPPRAQLNSSTNADPPFQFSGKLSLGEISLAASVLRGAAQGSRSAAVRTEVEARIAHLVRYAEALERTADKLIRVLGDGVGR
jgi:hypothetical protein